MVDDVEIYVSLRAKVLCLNLRYQRELVLPVYLLPKSSGYVAKSKNPVRIAVGSFTGFLFARPYRHHKISCRRVAHIFDVMLVSGYADTDIAGNHLPGHAICHQLYCALPHEP